MSCCQNKFFFHKTIGQIKTGKTGTHLSADTSPAQCSLLEFFVCSTQRCDKNVFQHFASNYIFIMNGHLGFTDIIVFSNVATIYSQIQFIFINLYQISKCLNYPCDEGLL